MSSEAKLSELEKLGLVVGLFLGIFLNILGITEYIEIREHIQDIDWMSDKKNHDKYVMNIPILIIANFLLFFSLWSIVNFCSQCNLKKIRETTQNALVSQVETTAEVIPIVIAIPGQSDHPAEENYGSFPAEL
ncbi:MAG: hypothetical protein Harvfovirus14_20 [Harvfovirus sp.]|uniref:Uncharacterized protein n=1 Tax=Harvfovirus sp. TaxID=2487768 RepID=A0A3G5A6E5_9VIRU|nr:MAG: hypothetical protein Harvfovirus14_20 [Harvfovirus sp.]